VKKKAVSTHTTTDHPGWIVVGVDGSESSTGALRRGVRIAAALEVPLEAVTAWRYPDLYGDYMGDTYVPDSQDFAHRAQTILDETARAVFGSDRPAWFHGTVREGRTAQTLIEESTGAEMLIVGSRGHGGFAGLLLGSVSEACAEHARCPVLVYHDTHAGAA
jgi:nucleotide-binding universal stress UspA family protein